MIGKIARSGALLLLAASLLASCNDSTERKVETGLDSIGDKAERLKDSAGVKLERLGDSLGPKLERLGDTINRKGRALKEGLKDRLDRNDTTKP